MRTPRTFERQLIGLAVAACFAGAVHANPTGPTVVNGSASFAASGGTLTVTNTPGAIINWQQFSIRPDEVTRFIQSGAASAVLNRVTGGDPSAILGQLLSNGRVFLINPNGVVVGAGARIDTAGFVASSLNLSNEDFLAGRFRFTDPGNAGKVTNAGTINAHSGGPVYLIAPTVENHGVITAPNGDILLAAGKSVELVSAASPHLRVQVQAGGETVNVGQLLADSGRVGLYGAAIRNAGTVSADSASVNAAGNVVLKASRDVTLEATSVVSAKGPQGGSIAVQAESGTLLAEGRIEASGASGKGGDVTLLGAQVGLVGNASVDASGAAGGGSVHIGGSRQGAGPLPNSRALFIGADASVDASATANGNGGTVIAYADEAARIYGHLSARGGPQGGDGGFIETSGRQYLDVLRTPDATASAGRGGEWLIDPNNILIVTAAGTCTNLSGCAAGPNWATTNDTAQLGVNLINNALNAGQNVTVTTTTSGANTQPGNITFQANANIAKTAGASDATVTLSAHNNIDTTGATISSANNVAVGRLNVVLTADSDSSGAGNVVVGAAVTTRGGSFTATGANISGAGAISTTGLAGRAGGNIALTAQPAGAVNVTGAMTATGGAGAAGNPGNAGGAVSLSGGTVTVGAISALGGAGAGGGFAGGTGGAVNVTKTGAAATAVTLNGLIDVRGGNATASATGGTGGTVSINAGAGSVATTAANLGTLINATGGTGQDGGTVSINAAGNINIAAAGNKAIVTSGGAASTNTAGRNAGNITLASTGGTVTARVLTANGSAGNGAGNNAGGSGGAISVSGVGVTLNGAVSATGGNSVNAGAGGTGGTVTVTGTTGTVSSVAAGTINVSGGRGQDAGTVTVSSGATGTVNLAGTITASGGAAETGSAGQNGGTVNASGGTVTVGAITALGTAAATGAGGTGGTVNLTKTGAAATALTLNGLIDVRGGNAAGSATGGTAGAVTINAGAGSVSTTAANLATLINATGGTGQHGGTVSINATGDINIAAAGNKAIVTSGGTASANTAGRNAGNITLASTGGTVTARVLTASGSAGVGGGNNAGGSGGAIAVSGVGATLNGAVSAVGGASVNAGAGGTGGTVTVTGTTGTVSSVAAGTINVSGGRGQNAGTVNVSSGATGTVNLAGAITASGGAAETGSAGQSGGAVSVSGGTITVGAVNALGSAAAAGTNLAGGAGGSLAVTKLAGPGTVTLSGAVSTRGGDSVGTGNGGASGAVTVNGGAGNVTVASTITTTGGRGQDAGAVSITTTGAVAVNNSITASGGTAATNASGRNGGAVSITGGSVATRAITTDGSPAVSAAQDGGNAGSINLTSTAGGITINAGGALSARAGAATTTGIGGAAGSIALNATGGNIAANAITTQGNAKTDGGTVTLAATGTTTATTINTSGGAGITSAGRAGGAVSVTGADVTVGAVTTSGGAGAGANQAGGNAGTILLDATDGSPTITLNGDVTAAGGARTGTGTPGNGAAITLDGNVVLPANRTINSAGAAGGGAGGAATFNGTVNSSGAARNLTVNAGTGGVSFGGALGSTLPAIGALAVTGNGIALAATNAASMTLTSTGGNITQTGPAVITGATAITGGTGAVTLVNAGNNFNTVTVASSASASIFDSNALTVGPVNATGNVLIQTALGAGNDLTLAGNVASTTGNVTLASGDDIHFGAFGPSAPAGRWLTYSFSPATNTGTLPVPGGAKPNLYNCTFGGPCGATVPATGNHNVYRYQPLLTYTANPANRQYGDPNPVFSGSVSGLVNGDTAADAYSGTLAFTSPAVATTPVGTAAINGSGLSSDIGYGFVQAPANATALTITPRPISVQANDQNRAYGDPNPATGPFTLTAGSLVGTDAIGSVNVTSPATATSPAGSVWVLTNTGANFTSGAATNYTITLQNGQLTIDPRAITVQANNQARAYGDPNPATGPYTITAGSLAGADAITNVNVTSPATVTSGVGPYALTPTAANFGSGAATNYTITFADGVLTVTPRPVTVTANNQTKVYGQPDPALTFTAPTVNGDVLAGTPVRAPGETVAGGPYAITQGTVTNANNPNYAITFVNGQLVITPAPLTIAADNQARLYGDANPPLTATFTGLTNGDTAAAIPGVTLTTPATIASNVGAYAINVASGANSNYTIAYANGQLTISPAPLTITADDAARRFGEPNPAFTATANGFKLGQTLASLNGALSLATPATVLSPVGAYPIVPSGVSSANYTITFVNGRLLIGQGIPPTDQALVTATQRSAESEDELVSRVPRGERLDCLEVERAGVRRVLSRCF